jgi:pre-mRNA-splicing factor ATP-dependent RNA helicase DHX15/PRP43
MESTKRKRKIDLGGNPGVDGSGSASTSTENKRRSQPADSSGFSPWTGKPFSSRYYSIFETRKKLPVYLFRDKLVDAVKANQVVIVEGKQLFGNLKDRMGLAC